MMRRVSITREGVTLVYRATESVPEGTRFVRAEHFRSVQREYSEGGVWMRKKQMRPRDRAQRWHYYELEQWSVQP